MLINIKLTNNDNKAVQFLKQFLQFAIFLNHILHQVFVDAVVEISKVLYKCQMFDQNKLAIVYAHTEEDLC